MRRVWALFLGLAVVAGAFETVVTVPSMKVPRIDSVIEASEWNGTFSQELVKLDGEKPKAATLFQMGCDKENLYLAFTCFESEVKKMRRIHTHIEERDGPIYNDDCVELFFDPFGNDNEGIFHFAINSNGIFYDAFNGDASFQSDIKIACSVGEDRWTAEIAIPFSDFGIQPRGAETIRVNVGRERQVAPPEYTCLGTGTGGFHSRDRLRRFRPVPEGSQPPPVTFLAFGSREFPELLMQNTAADDNGTYPVSIERLDENMKAIGTLEAACGRELSKAEYATPGDRKVFGYKYEITGKSGDGRYSGVFMFPKATVAAKLHTMKIAKPLFKELFSRRYPPQRDFHGFQWMFGAGGGGYMNIFGLQTGIPYSDYDVAKEHKATGMANYANVTMIDWMNTKVFSKELGTPLAVMPRVLQKNVKSGLDYNMPVVPEIKKLYLDDVRTIASSKDRGVRLMVFGDEMAEVTEARVIENFQKHPDNVELQALDKSIKEKYGQGKYGIPKTAEENDPLAWIAYRRGINDELVSLFHDAYKLAKSINPELIVVTDDPVSNMSKLYSFADWRGAFDIATHQLYPRSNPAVDSFGFMTRYLAQLTDAQEVWPCAHVEEYGASMTPEEVLCKLSACVRNGATGFHYYLNDSTGIRSKKKYMIHERWGAPDRYAVELGAQRLLAKMPRLSVPKYDSAVFVATDSLRAITGLMFRRPPSSDMYLHGFMGYGAGVNYRFINELTLQNLKGYKMIATVSNDYIPQESFDALRKYVMDGGTLLVLNQNAFKSTPEGKPLDAVRAELTGISATAANDGANSFKYSGLTVPTGAIHCAKFTLTKDAKALASFDNGTPAIVERRLGKGRVITLAANPCIAKLAGNEAWGGLFLKLAKRSGAKVKCDIWRFELPESLLPEQKPIEEKCLTDNYVRWEHYIPRVLNKGGITGSYTLSPEPNHVKDVSSGSIPFSKGKLTDRPRAVVAGSACERNGSWADWAIGWRQTAQPITIGCRLSKTRPIASVKLFVSGIWRDAAIEIMDMRYEFPCPAGFNDDPLSVREVTMALPSPIFAKDFKILIGGNEGNLTISEMEIWSK